MFTIDSLQVHEIPEKHVEIMIHEGDLYHPDPKALKESVKGFVHFWKTGKDQELENTPAADMYYKLMRSYDLDPKTAFNLCERYLSFKVYLLVASVE